MSCSDSHACLDLDLGLDWRSGGAGPGAGAELIKVQDCFRRLKFNYLEQETKRNFLFSITGDDPRAVSPGENEALGAYE